MDPALAVDPFAAVPLTHTPAPYEHPGTSGCVGPAVIAPRDRAAQVLASTGPRSGVVHRLALPGSVGRLPAGTSARFARFGSVALAFTLDGLFTDEECAALVAMAEAKGFYEAPVNVEDDKFRVIPEVRSNFQTLVDDAAIARLLWDRVAEYFPAQRGGERAGLNERMRFLRYDAGQKFEAHKDGPCADGSRFTFQLYLTDGFREGTTRFLSDDGCSGLDVVPRAGRVLAFEHGVMHRGSPPVGGRKYVLRTEAVYARVA